MLIIRLAAKPPYRRGPLSSNVRPHEATDGTNSYSRTRERARTRLCHAAARGCGNSSCSLVASAQPGERITIRVVRLNGAPFETEAVLEERPRPSRFNDPPAECPRLSQ